MKLKNISVAIAIYAVALTTFASSTSYKEVECSVEDQTCEKVILSMAQEEALMRVITGDQSEVTSDVLSKAIQIKRAQAPQATEAELINAIAKGSAE